MTYEETKCAEELIDFIDTATSPYHVAGRTCNALLGAHLSPEEGICAGYSYYFPLFDTGGVVVSIGENVHGPLRIVCAHTDFPCLRVKPHAVMHEHGYGKLNVEVYGGMIRSTWMDRPLSLAGAVAVRSTDPFAPQMHCVDFRRPLMIVPNLAIHMNRKVNEGVELKPQKDLLPLLFLDGHEEGADEDRLTALLAAELNAPPEEILSYELNAYPCECGCLLGADNAFLSAPRLDNLSSVKACLDAVNDWDGTEGIRVAALFDNEEVGSRTKQGAGSAVLGMILEQVYTALGCSREEYLETILQGFCLSVDVAHALHPNVPEKADPTNQPVLNGGVVLKVAANQSYAGDAYGRAVIRTLCEDEEIPYQVFTMRTVDIGVPVLGMHSARETMGAEDQTALTRLLSAFFSA